MSPALLTLLFGSVLGTSFISGLFGMAGGFFLMGILLQLFPLALAFALHGVAQVSSNLWRAVLWRRYIYVPVLGGYLGGALLSIAVFTALQIQLDIAFVYLFLGVLPFAVTASKRFGHLDVTKRGTSVLAGFCVVTIQLLAGGSGGFLDQFFVHSPLDRRQQLATKAAAQSIGHVTKVLYFTFLLQNVADWESLTWQSAALCIVAAVIGNSVAALVLQRLKHETFVKYSNYLLMFMGLCFLAKAGFLFVES